MTSLPTSVLRYTVDCRQPATHVLNVRLALEDLDPGPHTLTLPVWTPGSYEIKDYARHLFDVRAYGPDGQPLALEKTRKNVWRFDNPGGSVTVTYGVFAFEPGVSGLHVDATHAYWNGAGVFLFLDGRTDLPAELTIEAPPGWYASTGLDPAPDGDGLTFRAPDYDVLIDCPVEVGTHRRFGFDVDGKPHTVAIWGSGNQDDERLVADTRRIVETQAAFFGGLPYRHYTFIYHIADRGGGLEHLNSTTCAMPRHRFKPFKHYRHVLGLISHEFFHLWNVKRIHPEALGPFDYNQEVYTRLLWAMEGFTDYYAYLLLRRGGLLSVRDYLDVLAEEIKRYEGLPGRKVMSLAESSFDTWIKLYKPDADSPNRTISYYLKGGLVALLLDFEIRRRTRRKKSLDDVLRLLYDRFGRAGRGFPEHAYQDAVEEVAGGSLADFFARYIHGVDELPLDLTLEEAGLKIQRLTKNPDRDRPEAEDEDEDRDEVSDPPVAWLGIETRTEGGRPVVATAYDPGPAAGLLYPGDEIVALAGDRIADEKALAERLRVDHEPGRTVTVAVFRRGRLELVDVTLGTAPPNQYRIKRVDQPTAEQAALYEAWLAEPWPETPASESR